MKNIKWRQAIKWVGFMMIIIGIAFTPFNYTALDFIKVIGLLLIAVDLFLKRNK